MAVDHYLSSYISRVVTLNLHSAVMDLLKACQRIQQITPEDIATAQPLIVQTWRSFTNVVWPLIQSAPYLESSNVTEEETRVKGKARVNPGCTTVRQDRAVSNILSNAGKLHHVLENKGIVDALTARLAEYPPARASNDVARRKRDDLAEAVIRLEAFFAAIHISESYDDFQSKQAAQKGKNPGKPIAVDEEFSQYLGIKDSKILPPVRKLGAALRIVYSDHPALLLLMDQIPTVRGMSKGDAKSLGSLVCEGAQVKSIIHKLDDPVRKAYDKYEEVTKKVWNPAKMRPMIEMIANIMKEEDRLGNRPDNLEGEHETGGESQAGEICAPFRTQTDSSCSSGSPWSRQYSVGSSVCTSEGDCAGSRAGINDKVTQSARTISESHMEGVEGILAAAASQGDVPTSMSTTILDDWQSSSARPHTEDSDRRPASENIYQMSPITNRTAVTSGLSHAMNSSGTGGFGSAWVSGRNSLNQAQHQSQNNSLGRYVLDDIANGMAPSYKRLRLDDQIDADAAVSVQNHKNQSTITDSSASVIGQGQFTIPPPIIMGAPKIMTSLQQIDVLGEEMRPDVNPWDSLLRDPDLSDLWIEFDNFTPTGDTGVWETSPLRSINNGPPSLSIS